MAMIDQKKLIGFLQKAHTLEDLAKEFGVSVAVAKRNLKRVVDNHELFSLYDSDGSLFYRYCAMPEKLEIKPRVWQCVLSQDERIPYQVINFPDNDWERITIIPLYDVQWGSDGHDEKKFDEYIRFIEKTENAFAFGGGDTLQNALINSPGGSIYDQKMRPRLQVPTLIQKLAPIAHKMLWALTGNHEARSEK